MCGRAKSKILGHVRTANQVNMKKLRKNLTEHYRFAFAFASIFECDRVQAHSLILLQPPHGHDKRYNVCVFGGPNLKSVLHPSRQDGGHDATAPPLFKIQRSEVQT